MWGPMRGPDLHLIWEEPPNPSLQLDRKNRDTRPRQERQCCTVTIVNGKSPPSATSKSRTPRIVVIGMAMLLFISLSGFGVHLFRYNLAVQGLEDSWGITVPEDLVLIERHSQDSWHGDGYRLKIFSPAEGAILKDSFFDINRMSDAELSVDELELVRAVNDLFSPKNSLTVPRENLKKNSATPKQDERPLDTLLCLYDGVSNKFYIYEKRM